MKNKCNFIYGLVPTKTYVACMSYFSEEKNPKNLAMLLLSGSFCII